MTDMILGCTMIYLCIGFIFAVIHFGAFEVDENRMNAAKCIFWPITTVWYIIYAVIWLVNTLFLLVKHAIFDIFYLIKNFNL